MVASLANVAIRGAGPGLALLGGAFIAGSISAYQNYSMAKVEGEDMESWSDVALHAVGNGGTCGATIVGAVATLAAHVALSILSLSALPVLVLGAALGGGALVAKHFVDKSSDKGLKQHFNTYLFPIAMGVAITTTPLLIVGALV